VRNDPPATGAAALEPLLVALTSSLSPQRCGVCLAPIAELEVHVSVMDSAERHRLHGACAAASDDPEMRRFGLQAVAFESEQRA